MSTPAAPDLAQTIQFYATLFGAEPAVVKDDYAKWMLEDPRVNFAISPSGRTAASITSASRWTSAGELQLALAPGAAADAGVTRKRMSPAATRAPTSTG